MLFFRTYCCLLLLALAPSAATAQGLIDKVTDLLEFDVGKERHGDTAHFVPKVVIAPLAYYEPNTNFGFGIGAKLLFKPGQADARTRTSNLPIGISYTLNGQFFFNSSYTVFFPEERWLLRGNLDYSDFPQGYYGVGPLTTEEDRVDIGFQQFLFEPLLLRNVSRNIFLGGGVRYNTVFNTVLEEDRGELPAGTDLQDSLGSTSVGLEFAAILDTRDNVLNASRGTLIEFTQGFYGAVAGGTNRFQLTKLDLRRYRAFGDNTLAYALYGRYAWNDAPPQELSTLGGAELLRGYQENRFRDRVALFGQLEYRWQTWQRVGFAGFAGAGQVTDRVSRLALNELRFSVGAGLRIMVVPSERLNLRFDYAHGLGPDRDSNFYIGIAEAF